MRHFEKQDAKPAAQQDRYITADSLRILAQMQENFEAAMRDADADRKAGRIFRPPPEKRLKPGTKRPR
jgi:hypothetical protein